jgi:hypothetical protein
MIYKPETDNTESTVDELWPIDEDIMETPQVVEKLKGYQPDSDKP